MDTPCVSHLRLFTGDMGTCREVYGATPKEKRRAQLAHALSPEKPNLNLKPNGASGMQGGVRRHAEGEAAGAAGACAVAGGDHCAALAADGAHRPGAAVVRPPPAHTRILSLRKTLLLGAFVVHLEGCTISGALQARCLRKLDSSFPRHVA